MQKVGFKWRSGRAWLMAPVLKTGGGKTSVGSNPTSAAIYVRDTYSNLFDDKIKPWMVSPSSVSCNNALITQLVE